MPNFRTETDIEKLPLFDDSRGNTRQRDPITTRPKCDLTACEPFRKLSSSNRVTPVSIQDLAWDYFRGVITDVYGVIADP